LVEEGEDVLCISHGEILFTEEIIANWSRRARMSSAYHMGKYYLLRKLSLTGRGGRGCPLHITWGNIIY
jgi:hypothetical protein